MDAIFATQIIPRVKVNTVKDMVGVKSTNTIRAWIKSGTFPPPIKETERTHVWKLAEIKLWLEAKDRGASIQDMEALVKAIEAERKGAKHGN